MAVIGVGGISFKYLAVGLVNGLKTKFFIYLLDGLELLDEECGAGPPAVNLIFSPYVVIGADWTRAAAVGAVAFGSVISTTTFARSILFGSMAFGSTGDCDGGDRGSFGRFGCFVALK